MSAACAVLGWMVVALDPGSAAAQAPGLEALVDDIRAEAGAPGAILGLRFPDGTTLTAASGVANLESGRPIRAGDPFFLGSVSKTFTAATVLLLVEEGLLALEDPVARILPDVPVVEGVTVRQLLSHTSGLEDFYSYLYFRPDRGEMIEAVTRAWTQKELLALSGRLGTRFEPGTDWSYSSTNYFLLGVIVERVTGTSLPEAYAAYLFEPIGLERTWLTWHEPAPIPLRITGYLGPVDGWEHSGMFGELGPTALLDRSPVEWGAGGLAAPADDALRFLDALLAGDLLRDESLEIMRSFRDTPRLGIAEPGVPVAERPDGYGLGLVRLERPGYTLLGHGGLFTGHTAGLWHVPRCGVTISLYLNRGFVGQRRALDRVLSWLDTPGVGGARCPARP